MTPDAPATLPLADNLVLRHIVALRGEVAALRRDLLAMQAERNRDRALLVRLSESMDRGFADVRADALLADNRALDRHSDILDLARRLRALEPDDLAAMDEPYGSPSRT